MVKLPRQQAGVYIIYAVVLCEYCVCVSYHTDLMHKGPACIAKYILELMSVCLVTGVYS